MDPARPGRVELDGLGPIQADAAACRRIGSGTVDVLVRPERVELAAQGESAMLPNVLPMKITVVVNYGDSVLVIGDARGHTLRMRIAGAQPEAVREGATVTVGWAPSDAHLIARG